MRYLRRYTQDLYVIDRNDDADALTYPDSDYKVHVIDTVTGTIVWQSSPSERYGRAGVTLP